MDSTHSGGRPIPARFDALNFGLYGRYMVPSHGMGGGAMINTREWNLAVQSGEMVGDCRFCGNNMRPWPTEIAGQITWYTAQCVFSQCGRVIAAPNGEMLRRSSRHDEMPSGFWNGRAKQRG